MKKIIALAALAVSLMSGTAALAADYTADNNAVTGVNASGYTTVLIIKDGSKDISDAVYVGQSATGSTLSEEASFLLKSDPADGIYTLKLGGENVETKTSRFYIGMPITDNDDRCDVSFIDNGSVSFGWESAELDGYSTIILKLDDKVYGCELDGHIEGSANIGVVISDITAEVKSVDAYLSKTEMSSLKTEGASD